VLQLWLRDKGQLAAKFNGTKQLKKASKTWKMIGIDGNRQSVCS
jgi:hypothetical protein